MTKETNVSEYGLVEFCLKYPYTNSSSKYGTPLSAAVAAMSIPFILPMFVLAGYLTQVRRAAYCGEEEVPKFEFYRELFDLGKGAVIAQLPVLFISFIGAVGIALLQTPFFIGFFLISFYLSPVVAMKYALEGDYKNVYDRKLASIVSDSTYLKHNMLYSAFIIFTVFLALTIGSMTLGIGFFMLLPLLVVSRVVYWGYVFGEIEESALEGYETVESNE